MSIPTMTPQEIIARILAAGPVKQKPTITTEPVGDGPISVGQFYALGDEPYILAQIGSKLCAFIHLKSGNRWREGYHVANVHRLTQQEFESIGPTGTLSVTRIRVD
jgi:hypothetical protein